MAKVNHLRVWILLFLWLPIMSCSQLGKHSSSYEKKDYKCCQKKLKEKSGCTKSYGCKKSCKKKYKKLSSCKKSRKDYYGGCENHKIDLKNELSFWDQPSTQIKSPLAENFIPLGQKVEMVLNDEANFKFLVSPKKLPTDSKPFAGVTLLKVPESGLYKIAIGSRAWIEVIDMDSGNKSTDPHQFSMKLDCKKIIKAGEFKLSADKKYALQISSSPGEKILISVSK